jgi:tetratricopeptide (TPR) repeat protein
MLTQLGRPREALSAFEAQLTLSPNRLNGLAGAARAAELAAEPEVAARYYRALLTLAADADAGDDRLAHAREFLARPLRQARDAGP